MKRSGCVLAALWVIVSCGQELELPQVSEPAGAAAGAPASGVTGRAGASGAASAGRLNVPSGEGFTSGLGGEGGEASGGAGAGQAGSVDGPAPRAGSSAVGGSGQGSAANAAGASAGGGGEAGGNVAAGPRRLLFSEYVEAGGLKALELFAFEAASLEGCDLETYFNGSAQPGRVALHGEIAAGGTYVLCSSALAKAEPARCQRSTNLAFNGDDAVALRCAGELLDVIGQIGFDPGASWGNGQTADHTLRRRCEVESGRTDGASPFEPELEWLALDGEELLTDLGQRSCEPPQ